MKKSNKLSFFYIISNFLLLSAMIFGSIYGLYSSIGLNFVRSNGTGINNGTNINGVSNVSFGGNINYSTNSTGIIIVSIILIILSILDFISFIKQVVLFKQFKMIRESKIEEMIENKTKSKGSVIFFAFFLDILSLFAGIAGIFLNTRALFPSNIAWVIYLINGLIAVLSLVSFVLLFAKIKSVKKIKYNDSNEDETEFMQKDNKIDNNFKIEKLAKFNIDNFEYELIKLKNLKTNRLIDQNEYQKVRERIFNNYQIDSGYSNNNNF